MKGEIIRKAVQKAYGMRVRVIPDDFYIAIEKVKSACESLSPEDFESGLSLE
jgi:ParB family chromosome partitioning protein